MIEARSISKRFVKTLDLAARIAGRLGARVREETVHALDDVSITVDRGKVVGLVGESGCGKSTFGRIVAGIMEPTGERSSTGAGISRRCRERRPARRRSRYR